MTQIYDAITGHRLVLKEKRPNGCNVFEDLDEGGRITGFPLLSSTPLSMGVIAARARAWPLKFHGR